MLPRQRCLSSADDPSNAWLLTAARWVVSGVGIDYVRDGLFTTVNFRMARQPPGNPSATPHEDSPQIDHERPSFLDSLGSVSTRILLQMTVPLRDRKGSND